MKKFFKRALLSVAIIFILIISGIGLLFLAGKRNTDDVKLMCRISNGTPIEAVMKKTRELGFSETSQGALGGGLVVFGEDMETAIQWDDDRLPGLQSGKIKVGKTSLPPFLRNYCEISFLDRKVTSTRTWTFD